MKNTQNPDFRKFSYNDFYYYFFFFQNVAPKDPQNLLIAISQKMPVSVYGYKQKLTSELL